MNRKDHWESRYKGKASDDVSWYQKKPFVSLSLIKSLSLTKDENIIDVGGGASTLVDHLIKDGCTNVTVLDLSASALALAQDRLGDKAGLVEWIAGDITTFVPEKIYSLWHDRAVFHFLTEKADRENYKAILNVSVKEAGFVIIATFAIGGPTQCSGLEIVQYDAAKLQNELGSGFKLIEQRPEVHITPAGGEQLFEYFLFRKVKV